MLPAEAVTVTVAEPAFMILTPKPATTAGRVRVVVPVTSKNVPQSAETTL